MGFFMGFLLYAEYFLLVRYLFRDPTVMGPLSAGRYALLILHAFEPTL